MLRPLFVEAKRENRSPLGFNGLAPIDINGSQTKIPISLCPHPKSLFRKDLSCSFLRNRRLRLTVIAGVGRDPDTLLPRKVFMTAQASAAG